MNNLFFIIILLLELTMNDIITYTDLKVCDFMKSVAVIGSFRKGNHYLKIVELIKFLKKNNILVTSPVGSSVVREEDGFVFFETDDCSLSREKIEELTLENIFKADIVFNCNIDGYIGCTTAYEIGRCQSVGKEIIFLEKPSNIVFADLDIITMSFDELLSYARNDRKKRVLR